jgi:hypothetical protein
MAEFETGAGGKMLKGLVEVHRRIRYKILASERLQSGFGGLVSSTRIEELDLEVQVFDSGRVRVKGPHETWVYDALQRSFRCTPAEENDRGGEDAK